MERRINKIQLLIVWAMATFLISGCAVGFMTSYTQDPKTGKSIKTVYSPLFASDSLPLAEGVEFRVSVVNARRVEPISYTLLASIGGLPPEDMKSKATAVVHFKNDSEKIYRIDLKKLIILTKEFSIKIPQVVLKPGDRFDTKSIAVIVPTYDTKFSLDLAYELDGKSFIQNLSMQRETMEEINKGSRLNKGH